MSAHHFNYLTFLFIGVAFVALSFFTPPAKAPFYQRPFFVLGAMLVIFSSIMLGVSALSSH